MNLQNNCSPKQQFQLHYVQHTNTDNVMSFFSLSCRYYACLCGHEALVDYLLQNGELKISDELRACCDRGTRNTP